MKSQKICSYLNSECTPLQLGPSVRRRSGSAHCLISAPVPQQTHLAHRENRLYESLIKNVITRKTKLFNFVAYESFTFKFNMTTFSKLLLEDPFIDEICYQKVVLYSGKEMGFRIRQIQLRMAGKWHSLYKCVTCPSHLCHIHNVIKASVSPILH